MNSITLQELVNFDPRSPEKYPRRRFCCPFCGVGKSQVDTHRCLSLDITEGLYKCWRCGIGGKLGQGANQGYIPPPAPKSFRPQWTWQERVAKAVILPLIGSRGGAYLKKRGIRPELAECNGVRFAGSFHRRAAVLFDIVGPTGQTVAVQGRFVDGDSEDRPRMLTAGPKKNGVFATADALADRRLVITEAPIDALSLLSLFDISAVATCGTGLPDWFPQFARGKSIFIATDGDTQGDIDFDLWTPNLLAAGAQVKRMRPPNAGKVSPVSGKVMKDWNDELLLRKWICSKERTNSTATPATSATRALSP